MSVRKSITAAKAALAAIDTKTKSRDVIVKTLRAAGWSSVGSGAFATCMAHKAAPGIVIKVGQVVSSKAWIKSRWQDGFMNYVEATKTTQSRYALKVYHSAWVNELSGGTYVAIVERCQKAKSKAHREAISGIDNATASWGTSWGGRAVCVGLNFLEHVAVYGTLDCHGKNVMVRANGHLVITDPLVLPASR
ncbi:hypothetical protein J1C56_02270 [Aminobacter anthyllidis]|uniref:Uncharacterized protein n=1 Tax=Aminobacter anthyllidis TaxID=1035067 RepID=A0A9X1D121_9HYPH|nr:hypothetical protein [Aminobacter anthyllidis]MBT1154410.1 hypothetical protein [Aminobacter anthyllidis]